MKKTVLYTYLGTNGTIQSPVHLEDIYYIRHYQLMADDKKMLTRNGTDLFKIKVIPEDELPEWYEVSE